MRGASRRMGQPMRSSISSQALSLRALPSPLDSATLRKAMVSIRHAWRDTKGGAPFARLTDNAELASVACDERAELFAAGSLTPDHIVYTGARAVLAESLEELPGKLKIALVEKAPPRVAIIRNVGTFLLADDAKKLDAAESLAVAGAGITAPCVQPWRRSQSRSCFRCFHHQLGGGTLSLRPARQVHGKPGRQSCGGDGCGVRIGLRPRAGIG